MNLVIKIENNQPVNHPIMFTNFQMIYPGADYDNLPTGYAKFVRIDKPITGPFETVSDQPVYEWENGVVIDKWIVTPMTDAEKQAKIEEYRQLLPFPSWTLNETTLEFVPPIPYPDDGNSYVWNEDMQTWDSEIIPE